MKELSIQSVRLSLMNGQRVIVLKERDGERYLVIWVGPAEADAIAVKLGDVAVPRPLTHDLLRNVIEQLGAAVRYVIVTSVINDTYHARIVLDVRDEIMEIDSRPSDAIALAVRAEAPIYVDDALIEAQGRLVTEPGEAEEAPVTTTESRPLDPAELERLGVFRDFIEGLDLDDFDRPKK
jgi:bifunctional DNase/RNase